ncbi:MAG: hypothetical protein ACXWQR_00730 [Ktedonobacterales bacterium]
MSEMLGHANVGITLSIYGHVLPHMQQQAVNTMDAILQGSSLQQGSDQGSNQPHRGERFGKAPRDLA